MRELKIRVWDGLFKEFKAFDNYFCKAKDGILSVCVNNDDITLDLPTGLKDKNGKEIYEGDILESTWNGDKAVVAWNNVEGEWEHYADFNTHSKYSGSVVIGNIHENAELLGEEEE